MKNYLLIPFFALFVLTSCGSDESIGSSTNEPVLSSVTISSDLSSIGLGDTLVFSAFTNLGLDVTSESVFSIAGSSISGNTYTFQEQGNFTVKAAYSNIISNSIVINVSVPLTAINLSSNSDTYYYGEEVVFNVVGNNGANLTNQATISVVGGNELEGNTYTTSNEGVVGFIASYEDLTSPVYEINVLPTATKFNQNVLIEDYTGTWCGYCPRISYAIELVEEQTTDAYVVAIHRGSTNPSSGSYDPYNYSAGALENLIGLEGYPTGMLNRTTEWNSPEPSYVNQVINLTSGQADVGLALSPTLNDNTMNIDVNVKFGGQFSASNAKLVVYVLEDSLEFNQTNYTSYYGGGSVIPNFEHNHVLRASLTNLLGDQIPASEYSADNVYQVNFNGAVPSNVANTENMSVVAVVIDGSSNAAVNVRGADFGDTQTFEEL
ncbi:MAG: Omp28-related outer membrane protein [Bacteroidetes bacterium]|nr:Omp28-related outer membrane protein [Bacteroidota bacterium]MDA1175487.1 Omp28-related outer membrane protein [Bacteroidota bacterium]